VLYFFFVFVVLQQFVKTNQQSCSCRPLTDNKMAAVNMAVVAMLLSYFVIPVEAQGCGDPWCWRNDVKSGKLPDWFNPHLVCMTR